MKLLFDQNISYRIVRLISQVFPEAQQVNSLGLHGAKDSQIWQFAKDNEFTIVTFDADFVDIANLQGNPPKIIWLRVGNTKTTAIAELLIANFELIQDFITAKQYSQITCLEID